MRIQLFSHHLSHLPIDCSSTHTHTKLLQYINVCSSFSFSLVMLLLVKLLHFGRILWNNHEMSICHLEFIILCHDNRFNKDIIIQIIFFLVTPKKLHRGGKFKVSQPIRVYLICPWHPNITVTGYDYVKAGNSVVLASGVDVVIENYFQAISVRFFPQFSSKLSFKDFFSFIL